MSKTKSWTSLLAKPKTNMNKKDKISKLRALLENKQISALSSKIGELIEAIKNRPQPQIIAKLPPMGNEIQVTNFPEQPKHLKVTVDNQPAVQSVRIVNPGDMKDAEAWNVHVVNQPPPVKQEKASSWVPQIVTLTAVKIVESISKIISRGVPVTLSASERVIPMSVVIVDIDGKPLDIRAAIRPQGSTGFPMIMHGNVTTIAGNCVSGRVVVGTTFTAGSPFQLPNVGCKRIIFTSIPSNGGTFAIGGKTVSAQSGSESGAIVYPTGTAQIDVNQANVLWVDGSNSGDVLTYNILS